MEKKCNTETGFGFRLCLTLTGTGRLRAGAWPLSAPIMKMGGEGGEGGWLQIPKWGVSQNSPLEKMGLRAALTGQMHSATVTPPTDPRETTAVSHTRYFLRLGEGRLDQVFYRHRHPPPPIECPTHNRDIQQ